MVFMVWILKLPLLLQALLLNILLIFVLYLPHLFPVLQRTHTVYLFKKSAEIIGIAKAKLVGYFLDTFWRFGEHCLCDFVFVPVDVSFV